MDRRHGPEGMFGIAGGKKVSPESEKNLNIARDLCQRRRPYEAVPYLQKALKDKRNIDAGIELAFLAPTKDECVEILEEAAERGKRILLTEWLGPNAFDDNGPHVGHFWGILETRPYMRALSALGRMYFETGKYTKSTAIYIEMLRLNPGDNQSARTSLGSSLIRDGRYADALYFAQTWLKNYLESGIPMQRGGTDFKEPSRELYTPEVEEKLNECWSGVMVHTGALASFKLWGDCDLSRQLLRIAAKVNPFILLRILGKITRPTELNMLPRGPNSPEEAHDYLWLSQDLWMEDDVWNWADNNPDAKQVILKNCSNEVQGCRTREGEVAQFKRCSACRLVSYCSTTCQKAPLAPIIKAGRVPTTRSPLHTVRAVSESFHLSKDAGFKVVAHMMPDLPNVGVERDLEQFKEYFENPMFRSDGLKIYPTLVIRGTGLYELWRTGRYKNYTPNVLVDVVARILALVPPWTRVYRVQRDIPLPLVSSGCENSGNLRELALNRMKDFGAVCRDVRFREVGIHEIHHKVRPESVELLRRDYTANGGWETFLSYEDPEKDILIGLLRLRKCSDEGTFRPELVRKPGAEGGSSIVRELHVYGTAVPVHGRDPTKFQHQGFGTLLMEEAERIAREEHGSVKLAVISGVGTRDYYRKLGYELDGPYMSKMLV
ncbi:hypothetical protein NMY22_g17468 [Coprinellus aureogranulatus]|nr:hypothetical protein NMY22_g17468 [Coprinellus aureogranulatus]